MELLGALVSLNTLLLEAIDAKLVPLASRSFGVVGEMGLIGDCTVSITPAFCASGQYACYKKS